MGLDFSVSTRDHTILTRPASLGRSMDKEEFVEMDCVLFSFVVVYPCDNHMDLFEMVPKCTSKMALQSFTKVPQH